MPKVTIETTGIKEALAAMDRVDRLEAQLELKDEFNKVAVEVVNKGRSRASGRMEQAAARTLRTASTATYGAVGFGGGFGGAFGAEFGGYRNQRRVVNHFGYYTGWNQFKPWKGSGSDAGYFLWPTIRQVTADRVDDLAEAVAKIVEKG
jgi:hypothetical protein